MTDSSDEIEGDAVVISGISGRFPNSDNVAELNNNLYNKIDCTNTGHARWNIGNTSK